jgi:hypothetical protein
MDHRLQQFLRDHRGGAKAAWDQDRRRKELFERQHAGRMERAKRARGVLALHAVDDAPAEASLAPADREDRDLASRASGAPSDSGAVCADGTEELTGGAAASGSAAGDVDVAMASRGRRSRGRAARLRFVEEFSHPEVCFMLVVMVWPTRWSVTVAACLCSGC